MIIRYETGIRVDAGWRQVTIRAKADQVSKGFAVVREVLTIAGETPGYSQSITGAKRQSFNGLAWARLEINKKKRISACTIEGDAA